MKLDDMGKILGNFHQFVPTVERMGKLALPNGSYLDFDDTRFHQVLVGGDQLTVARARGAQGGHAGHDTPLERLVGVIPVVEDWHCRMTLMRVSDI